MSYDNLEHIVFTSFAFPISAPDTTFQTSSTKPLRTQILSFHNMKEMHFFSNSGGTLLSMASVMAAWKSFKSWLYPPLMVAMISALSAMAVCNRELSVPDSSSAAATATNLREAQPSTYCRINLKKMVKLHLIAAQILHLSDWLSDGSLSCVGHADNHQPTGREVVESLVLRYYYG